MRLSPEASRELLAELNRPAADTPERRRTFERVAALQDRLDFRASQVVSGKASRKYMASLRKSRHDRWRVFGIAAALAVAAFLVMATGCASLPVSEEPAISLPTENQLLEPIVIYVNDAWIAHLEAQESRTLLIRESLLRGGRCMEAVAFLTESLLRLHSTEECLPRGGKFTLSVAVGHHIWLNPWE